MQPLVSIIIPAYNAEEYLSNTIQSALDQTYPNKEIIIVDDGSTDNTARIANDFVKKNKNIYLVNQKNYGASSAKQAGFDFSKGEYIQYLDADDLLGKDKIEKQADSLNSNPLAVAVCQTLHFFNGSDPDENNIPEPDYYFDEYLKDPLRFLIRLYGGFDAAAGMIQPNAFLIRRDIAIKAGKWNTDISPCPDEDGEYFCRVILSSEEIIFNRDVYNYYRKLDRRVSLSAASNETAFRNLFKSNVLKHQHLLDNCPDKDLIENINYATFQSLFELQVRCYPSFPSLSDEIAEFCSQLRVDKSKYKHRLGGRVINVMANKLSWKLARRIQKIMALIR